MDPNNDDLMRRTARTVAVMLAAWALFVGGVSATAVLVTSRAVAPKDDVAETRPDPTKPAAAPARGARS